MFADGVRGSSSHKQPETHIDIKYVIPWIHIGSMIDFALNNTAQPDPLLLPEKNSNCLAKSLAQVRTHTKAPAAI